MKKIKIACAALSLSLLGGCAPTMGGMGGGADSGAPFAPYSATEYGSSMGYGGPVTVYGQPQGCGMGYGPVQGCGGPGNGYGQPQRQQGTGGGWLSKEVLGGLGGAAAGGLAGAQIGSGSGQLATTAAGALLGAFVGGNVGRSLDQADEAYAWMQLQRSLAANQPVVWQGQQAAGRITPIRTVPKKKKSDQTCREFRHEVMIGDQAKEGVGRACLQRDGSWKLANG
jgi:surface antigen